MAQQLEAGVDCCVPPPPSLPRHCPPILQEAQEALAKEAAAVEGELQHGEQQVVAACNERYNALMDQMAGIVSCCCLPLLLFPPPLGACRLSAGLCPAASWHAPPRVRGSWAHDCPWPLQLVICHAWA
jgi:hypothetical protein